MQTDVFPRTIEDQQLFKKFAFTYQDTSQSTQTAKTRQENLELEAVIGSLTPATIVTNFEL